jgi:NADPH:quinone reductase
MKAITYTATGDPSVLTLVEREAVEPGEGEARVRIVVSGVNPTDWKIRQGQGLSSAPQHAQVVPGMDGAGVVDVVGPGVSEVAAGDRVWVLLAGFERPASGTAQELTVLPVDRLVPLPDGASFDIGASLGVPAITAHRALTVAEDGPTRLGPGELDGRTVLVAGGAGAVGHAAIQLAKWAGATVITTTSGPEKAHLARAAGAHHVVNYREEDAAERIRAIAPDGVDLIVEVAPAPNAKLDLAVLANHGTIAVYASEGGNALTLPVGRSVVSNLRYQFLLLYTVHRDALTAAAEDITAALRSGALPVGEDAGLPLLRFPLECAADAHAAVEDGTVGKVLIDVSAG